MRSFLIVLAAVFIVHTGFAQITITASDMPVAGDSLVYSNVSPLGSAISPADSGAGFAWNYTLAPISQSMDVYLTPTEVSPFLTLTLHDPGLYGYQFADSLPFIGALIPGITITNLYTFFEKLVIPSSFVAEAFSATISSFPAGTTYTEPDVWYIFPLTYGSHDSNNYSLHISLLTAGALTETGYRKTTVDGWGTITTPYFTTPVNCIRVRSEIHEIDSVTFGTTTIPVPRNSVEYKWLVNGAHYPALWVTSTLTGSTETITSVTYRDIAPPPSDTTTVVHNIQETVQNVTVYPNPSLDGMVTLGIPKSWANFHVDVFDIQSRLVVSQNNERVINMSGLPAGNYVARVSSGTNLAFVPIVLAKK